MRMSNQRPDGFEALQVLFEDDLLTIKSACRILRDKGPTGMGF
jgi:hypothetical protein